MEVHFVIHDLDRHPCMELLPIPLQSRQLLSCPAYHAPLADFICPALVCAPKFTHLDLHRTDNLVRLGRLVLKEYPAHIFPAILALPLHSSASHCTAVIASHSEAPSEPSPCLFVPCCKMSQYEAACCGEGDGGLGPCHTNHTIDSGTYLTEGV